MAAAQWHYDCKQHITAAGWLRYCMCLALHTHDLAVRIGENRAVVVNTVCMREVDLVNQWPK
jgi:hypothetical protein